MSDISEDIQGGVILDPPLREVKSSRRWCMTLNNYSAEEYTLCLDTFSRRKMDYIIGKEVGESGTPHLQMYIEAKSPIQFNSLKRICNRMHIEKARGKREENIAYCSKDEDFVTSFNIRGDIRKKILNTKYKDVMWKPWQQMILDIIETEPDERTIWWVHDGEGNSGKSFLTKYICCTYDVIIGTGKKGDVFHQICKLDQDDKEIPKIIILDIPRDTDADDINYGAIEQIKNGLIFSGKYEGGQVLFDEPHVIVFSNYLPKRGKWSDDRVRLIELDNN